MTYLLTHELLHVTVSLIISTIFYTYHRRKSVFIWGFIFGVLVDIDHLFDYFAYYRQNFMPFNILSGYMEKSGKIYIPFHGYEYLPFLWFLGKRLKLPPIIPLAYISHLLIDHFTYQHHPLAYFLIYRLLTNFKFMSFRSL